MLSNFSNRGSGTEMVPTLGSMVQNGKLADCALAFDKQLNNVDLPTFGSPTIPHFNAMMRKFDCKGNQLLHFQCYNMNSTLKLDSEFILTMTNERLSVIARFTFLLTFELILKITLWEQLF